MNYLLVVVVISIGHGSCDSTIFNRDSKMKDCLVAQPCVLQCPRRKMFRVPFKNISFYRGEHLIYSSIDSNVTVNNSSLVVVKVRKNTYKFNVFKLTNKENLFSCHVTFVKPVSNWTGAIFRYDIAYYHDEFDVDVAERLFLPPANKSAPHAPYFLFRPDYPNVLAGDSVNFTCHVHGIPRPDMIWYRDDGSQIMHHDAYIKICGEYSLCIDRVTNYLTGNYTCVASNKYGSVNYTIELAIGQEVFDVKSPKVLYVKHEENVTLGSKAHFQCVIDNYINLKIYWRHTNSTIINPNFRQKEIVDKYELFRIWLEKDKRISVDSLGFLTIKNVTYNDTGFYSCLAFNPSGYDLKTAFLNVIPPVVPNSDVSVSQDMLIIIVSLVTLFLLTAILFVFYLCRRIRAERVAKKRIFAVAQQLKTITRRILIDSTNVYENDGVLVPPRVTIERISTSDILQNNSSTITSIAGDGNSQMFIEYQLPKDPKWELDRGHIQMGRLLGEGNFGRVVKATLTADVMQTHAEDIDLGADQNSCQPNFPVTDIEVSSNMSNVPSSHSHVDKHEDGPDDKKAVSYVALKMIKEGYSDEDLIDFVSEIELMKLIGKHRNVIQLIGVCSQNGPLMAAMEFCLLGNLRNYLLERSTLMDYELPVDSPTFSQLLNFCLQIAQGMCYLSSINCVHRDLAARNILVDHNLVLKVADFGLARKLSTSDYYRKTTRGLLPVRWMAPESLSSQVYTTKSDVWSFGIVMWEIFTFGAAPCYAVNNVAELITQLNKGARLRVPSGCPVELYSTMLRCWDYLPVLRPRFEELVSLISDYRDNPSMLDFPIEESYDNA